MDALHIISDQKNAQGGGASSRAANATNLAENSHKKSNLRGGRGRRAGPELARAMHDVQASETRLKHDIVRLNGDKERLIEQVDDLEKRIVVAKEEGLLKSTIKRLEALLTEAHDKLKILEGVIPAESSSRDRALMEEVLKKWREYEHERTNQARAESKISQSPENKHAEGDFNRARATAHALKEEIHALVKQGELVVENSTPSPMHDEWVSYTREQARVEREVLAKKHKKNITVSTVFEDNKNEKIAAGVALETAPPIPASPPDVREAVSAISKVPLIPPVTDIHPTTTDTDIHPIITDGVSTEELKEKEIEVNYLAKADVGEVAWEHAQQQLEKIEKKNFANKQKAQQTPLIVPEEVMVGTNTELSVKEEGHSVEQVGQPEATTSEQPSPEILAKRVEQAIPVPEETASDEQNVRTYAEEQVHAHINKLFGKKGFLGFVGTAGMDSIDWKDPQVGFANKTIARILEIKTETLTDDGTKYFGVEDPVATDKMQKYLQFARTETGVDPLPGEKVEDYLMRASVIIIGKFIGKG